MAILQKEKWYIESFCYNVVENHLYTKFGKKKKILKTKNVLIYARSFMCFYFFLKKLSPDVLYRGHSITYELNII